MEGQASKIRTMAGDLESAKKESIAQPKRETEHKLASPSERGESLMPKQRPRIEPPVIKPREEKAEIPTPQKPLPDLEVPLEQKTKTLSDILKQAKEKAAQKEERPTSPSERGEPVREEQEEDLLPIEDSAPASGPKISEEIKRPPRPDLPSESEAGPAPQNIGEPPPNLPTADAEETLPSKEIAYPHKQEPELKPQKTLEETPEEILGLPATNRQALQAGKPASPSERVEKYSKTEQAELEREKPKPIPPTPSPQKEITTTREKALETRPTLPKGKRKPSAPKFAIITALLGITIVAIAGGLYFIVFKESLEDQEITIPTTPITEPQPAALLEYGDTHTIDLEELVYEGIKPEIDALSRLKFPKNSITNIQIKHTTPELISYLDFDELTNILGISAPSQLLNKNHNLFIYTPGEEEMNICEDANITDTSCYGPRLGLIIDIGENETTIADAMLQWEKTLPADLAPLILANYIQDIPEFNSSNHRGVSIRYKNLTQEEGEVILNTTSIDWAITNRKLIIGTSMNTVRSALDKLIVEP